MSREKEDYRLMLADIMDKFPGKNMLTLQELKQYLGYSKNETLLKDKSCPLQKISGRWLASVVRVARWLSA